MSHLDWSSLSDDEDVVPAPTKQEESNSRRDEETNKGDEAIEKRNEGDESYAHKQQTRRVGGIGRTGTLPPIPKDGPSPFLVIVSNLKYEATIDDVGNFFVGGGCDVIDIKMSSEAKGRALVYMQDRESQEKSLGADGHDFMGRPLHVRVYHDHSRNSQNMTDRRTQDRPRNTASSNRPGGLSDRERHDPSNYVPSRKLNAWDRGHTSEPVRARPSAELPSEPIPNKQSDKSDGTQPKERPPLKLKPRTAPIEEIGKPVSASSIFGEGKPRDVFVHEVMFLFV